MNDAEKELLRDIFGMVDACNAYLDIKVEVNSPIKCPNCDEEMEEYEGDQNWQTIWFCHHCKYEERREDHRGAN